MKKMEKLCLRVFSQKCANVLKIRKEHNLKYANLELPDDPNGVKGYHLNCYKRFVGLSKHHRESLSNMEQQHEQEI